MIVVSILRMDSDSSNKILCRLCAKESERYFEIFGEQGIRWKIASVISSHFWFELSKGDEYSLICHTCWWKIETFHIYYLEIQAAQTVFESNSVLQQKFIDKKRIPEDLKEETITANTKCNNQTLKYDDDNYMEVADENAQNVNVSIDMTDEAKEDEFSEIFKSTGIGNKLDYESEPLSDGTQVPLNKSQSKRKRDNPVVLAEDDLIRNWCEMRCTKCPELFIGFTFKDVKVHYHKEHGMNGYLLCCEKKFFRRVRALEHIARHINPNVFSCEKCNKTFSDKPSLLNHLDGHASPDQKKHKCNNCNSSFVRRYQLSQHQKLRHFSDEKKFVCEKCPKSFITKSILQSHIRGVHSNNTLLMCDVCAKTFKSKQCLHQHLSEHKGGGTQKVQCNICSVWLKHQNSLRGHMARHKDAEFDHICNECGKSAPSRGALRSHQKYVHSNAKQFSCNLCVKSFKKSLTLKEHIASCHTGEVLYACPFPFCSKTFNSSANLCSHKKRVHQTNLESLV